MSKDNDKRFLLDVRDLRDLLRVPRTQALNSRAIKRHQRFCAPLPPSDGHHPVKNSRLPSWPSASQQEPYFCPLLAALAGVVDDLLHQQRYYRVHQYNFFVFLSGSEIRESCLLAKAPFVPELNNNGIAKCALLLKLFKIGGASSILPDLTVYRYAGNKLFQLALNVEHDRISNSGNFCFQE